MRALLPPHVLAVLEADDEGRQWLDTPPAERRALTTAIKWRTELPDDVRGWVIGIGIFDDPKWTKDMGRDERLAPVIPALLDAFVAGALAGLHAPRAWLAFEQILHDSGLPVPAGLDRMVALGLASTRAHDRSVAERLAPKVGVVLDAAVAAPPRADEAIDLLRRLVAHWGDTYDEALEDPIARIGQQIAHGRGAIRARSKQELEKAWHLVAERRDAGDVDRLLDTPWPHLWKTATLRLNALAKFRPDPRISTKLAIVAMDYDSLGSFPFHTVVGRLLALAPTPAVLSVLDRLGRRPIYGAARAAIEARISRPADPALLAEAHAAAPAQEVPALWTQLAANPGDAGLRAVLADALMASGDPRGEFIMLQTRLADGDAEPAVQSRADALLDAHGKAWLARLPGIERFWFARGFPVRLECSAGILDIKATLDRPEWTTIEDLRVTNIGPDLVDLAPRMPLLHTLCLPTAASLEQLEAAGTYPAIRVLGAADWLPVDRRAFPNLEVLGGRWVTAVGPTARITAVARAARVLGVRAIVHVGPPRQRLADIVASLGEGPPELRLLIDSGAMDFHAIGWCARIFRDARRAEIAMHPSYRMHLDELSAALAAAGITDVVTVDQIDVTA